MSFILDALKKSENERQRHIGPSLADVQVRRREGNRPWWVVAVAALLVINLSVLLLVLTRNNDASGGERAERSGSQSASPPVATSPSTVQSITSSGSAAAPTAAPQTPGPTSAAVRSLADEAGAFDAKAPELSSPLEGPDAAALVPAGPPIVRQINPPTVSPMASRPAAESSEENTEVLPTLSDLLASGAALPELHLDIHVHSDKAAERFVFVNMRKYVEGQSLSEGPRVERITGEGVVLNQRGLRFLLPRQ
jgi:general secretion pathway protein B